MPRRREVPKRKILPDPTYGDRLVAKFINSLMLRGKKSVAEQIVYTAFDLMERGPKMIPPDFQEGNREREAFPRGEEPPRWRLDLPGAG
jgi:hypothetical protein